MNDEQETNMENQEQQNEALIGGSGLDAGLGLTHTFTGLRFGWRGK